MRLKDTSGTSFSSKELRVHKEFKLKLSSERPRVILCNLVVKRSFRFRHILHFRHMFTVVFRRMFAVVF